VKRDFSNYKGNTFQNERLEFLGDAVLDMFVSRCLFEQLTTASPGMMTKLKHLITSNATLQNIGKELQFENFILSNTKQEKAYADCVESFIGAMYIDQGYTKTNQFIQKHVFKLAQEMIEKMGEFSGRELNCQTFESTFYTKTKLNENKIKKDLELISELEKHLGIHFKNKFILLEATTHGKLYEIDEYRNILSTNIESI
jgi:dsRNA-specific ribonuclease